MKTKIPASVNNDNKKIGFIAKCKEKLIAAHNALPVEDKAGRATILKEILEIDVEIFDLKDKDGVDREAYGKTHKDLAVVPEVDAAVAEFIVDYVSG